MTTQHTTTTHRISREDRQYIESHLERINGLLRSFLENPCDASETLQDLIRDNIEWGTDAIQTRIERARVETTIIEVVQERQTYFQCVECRGLAAELTRGRCVDCVDSWIDGGAS